MTDKTPKWSSVAARGLPPQKEKDNMPTTSEVKSSENSELEAAGQQESAKMDATQKNIPNGNGHDNAKNRGGNSYRGSRGGRGGRGKPFYNNYNNVYQQLPPPQPGLLQYPAVFAPPQNFFPPPGYVHPMPQHIRTPNQTGVEAGKSVLAPFTDNNYYLGVVISVDEIPGLSLVKYNHCPLPHFIHTEYLQLCHV